MLYDKRWDKKPKVDMYSLASLISWLEQQEPNGTYCYGDNGRCLLGQYFSEKTGKRVLVGSNDVCFATDETGWRWSSDVEFPFAWAEIARQSPWTFGGALKRARAAHTSAERET